MSSKYDVVKLKVHLSGTHYYVLSRFLLSKLLMFCRIPEDAAVRISLDVKKHFVNCEQTSITQEELETYLKSAMAAFGFSTAHTRLFPVVTQFHTQRIPLVLLISGPPCCGKTTLAHLLSERLNCSTIINAEVLHDINDSIDDLVLCHSSNATYNNGSELRTTSSRDAREEQEGKDVAAVTAEMDKAMREGKVMILEGERLRLSSFRHVLDPAFQKSAGAVIFGVVLESLDRPPSEVCAEYNESISSLQSLYETENLSVMCGAATGEGRVFRVGEAPVPNIYVARCRTVGDNLELADFLHSVIIARIIEELQRRGKLPACEEAAEENDLANLLS